MDGQVLRYELFLGFEVCVAQHFQSELSFDRFG